MSNDSTWGWKKVGSILGILAILGGMAYTISVLVVAPVEVKADNNTVVSQVHRGNSEIHTPGQQWKAEMKSLENQIGAVEKQVTSVDEQMKIYNQNWNKQMELPEILRKTIREELKKR